MSVILNASVSSSTELSARPRFERPLSSEQFAELRSLWLACSRQRQITSSGLAAWMAIKGKDPAKAFAPITNPVKLANGASPWGSRDQALRSAGRLHRDALAPWESLLLASGQARLNGWRWEGDHWLLAALREHPALSH